MAFGQARGSQVATLGLNPSKSEFLDQQGRELRGRFRRLATHTSLGTSDLANAPMNVISQVLRDCDTYFERNPYRRWFDQLEPFLSQCGASYYDGTACHLDLVQWATDPTWNRLPNEIQRGLLASDVQFLVEQLDRENIRLLLLNGRGVIDQLRDNAHAELVEVSELSGLARISCRLFVGTFFGRIKIVGWSTNIQSSFGVTRELREEIARRVGLLAG